MTLKWNALDAFLLLAGAALILPAMNQDPGGPILFVPFGVGLLCAVILLSRAETLRSRAETFYLWSARVYLLTGAGLVLASFPWGRTAGALLSGAMLLGGMALLVAGRTKFELVIAGETSEIEKASKLAKRRLDAGEISEAEYEEITSTLRAG